MTDLAIARSMSNRTSQILEVFDAVPEEEKRAFTVEFLRRVPAFDSGPLDDSETADAADALAGLE